MTSSRSLKQIVAGSVFPTWYAAGRARRRWRRAMFMARTWVAARACGSRIDMWLAPDVQVGRRMTMEFQPNTVNTLRIGSGTTIADDVVFMFLGGDMVIGERVQIRRGFVADTAGKLSIGDDAILSFGAYVHCTEATTVGELTGLGEYVTVTDSIHVRTQLDEFFGHHVKGAPVTIGRNCWLAAHAVVGAGVHIGDGAFVGANSTVLDDVPAGWLAAGSPARPLKQLEVIEAEPSKGW